MLYIFSLRIYFVMLFHPGRSPIIMMAIWVFILWSNLVFCVEDKGFLCSMNATDRIEDALRVCKIAIYFETNNTMTDLSKVSEEDLKFNTNNGLMIFTTLKDFKMVSNSKMRRFLLQGKQAGRLEIRRNRNLVELEVSYNRISGIRISGNPQLSKESIARLHITNYDGMNEYSERYTQQYGECEFDESVKNTDEFEFCKYVEGDLIMENTVGSRVDSKLHAIFGCLRIINTELKNVDFLDGIERIAEKCKSGEKSEISGNKNLWIHSAAKEKLNKIVKMEIKVHPDAVGICTPVEALTVGFDCTHVAGGLKITGGVSLHNLKTIKQVDGKITIERTDVDSLSFPELTSVGKPDLGDPVLLVIDNPQLASVSFPKLEKAETASQKLIVVKGNEKFNNADSLYKEFFKVAGDKGLEIECHPDKEITELSQLNGCISVHGDLVLKGTTGETTTKLTQISACVKVIGTSLKDLSFLELDQTPVCTTESEISGNKDLCLSRPFVKDLSDKIGKINYIPDGACDISCSQTEFEEFMPCNVLDGDLSVTSGSGQETTLSKIMAKVKRITGKLTISGITDETIVFPELLSVGNPSLTGEAILIEGNEDLKEVSIPKLTSVETGGNVAIIVKGYKMAKDQAKILKEGAGSKEFKLECDLSNKEVKEFTELDYCTSVKGDLLLKNTQGIINTKIESIGGCLRVIDTEIDTTMFDSLIAPLQSETCQSGEKSEVKGNKKLCLVWGDVKNARSIFGKTVEFSFDESCELPCTQEEFAEDGSYCEQFNGLLKIDENTDVNVSKTIFDKLKRIKGRIELYRTTLDEVNFSQLSLIENDHIFDPAVSISENTALRVVSMPRLKKLVSDDPNVIIYGNDKFRMSNELKTALENAMKPPGQQIIYQCHESTEISDFSRLEGCEGMSSGVHFKGKISGNLPETKLFFFGECLQVENTDLQSLDFLQIDESTGNLEMHEETGINCGSEHSIKNNENLCISPFLERQLVKIRPKWTITGNKPRDQCPVFCTAVNGTIPDHECNIVKGELRIESNCSFDQNLALVERIDGGLVVKDCSLSSLEDSLPKLMNVSSSGIALVLENVENYSNLKDLVKFKLESENSNGLLIKITTNQEIPYMVDADLKAHFGSKRVDVSKVEKIPEGVCVFVDPAFEVKNCKTVEGDLVLDEKTVSVSSDLTEISGCVVIQNTNMEDYGFLTKIEKVGEKCRWNEKSISNNSCIPYDVRRKSTGKVKELVDTEENKKDCYECSGTILPGQECKVIIGDLEVNQGSTPELANQLDKVKEIYGRLIIKNTNLPQISLTGLTKIEASESEEPAIEITGNSELSILQMPSLINATSKGKVVVKIEENKKLKKTAELTEQLGKATGSQCAEGKSGACQFSQVKEAAKATDTKEKTTTEEEGVSKTVVIVLGVVGAVLLVSGLIGVAVIVVLIRKKRAKNAMKGKGPGKPPKSTMSKVDSKNLPPGEDKTKSVTVEKGAKSLSEKKVPEASKEEASKDKKENEAPGESVGENAPAPVPNAL